ncbi:MAG: hypothetical protein SGI87_10705 [Flavobacteriales bacterium]|nr:hypothetical protein [Flavobacteriales bacterium]
MWKSLFVIWLVLTLPKVFFGQYVEEIEEIPLHHHSFGINVSPALVLISGGLPVNPRIGIVYKNQTRTSRKFRLTFNAQFYDPFDIDPDVEYYGLALLSDTTRSIRYRSSDKMDMDFRIGLEWSNPTKKVTPFYGIDLILGHSTINDIYGTKFTVLDTAFCSNCYVDDITVAPLYNSQTSQFIYAGFDFTVGWKIVIKNKVDLYLQFSPEFRYQAMYNEILDLDEPRMFNYSSGIDFRLRVLEAWVSYRF